MDEGTNRNGHGGVRSIVVVGGGTAGWMSAAYLARRLAHLGIAITVVDSSSIGTVGVGEATVPAIRDFLATVELGEVDVLRETEGTLKLGIRFDGWTRPGERFFHPFGLYGVPARGVAFHHYWLKLRAAGDPTLLGAYCLATQLAEQGLFLPPPDRPANELGVYDFALHFDASKFADLLRRLSLANGVRHVDGIIRHVARDGENGRVRHVVLDDGGTIEGDLWIDCSGFRSLLIGDALGNRFHDWREWLPCDRAVAIGCESAGDRPPLTTATARGAGWQWHIPLRHRTGNGYVYSSAFLDDDAAEAELRASLEAPAITAANRLRFVPGHRDRFWDGNVVAIGLAAGFLEPLESTSITLIQSGLERFVQLFPDAGFDPRLAATYNRQSTLEFERIRDFLLLHYCLNRRTGEPFWDHMRARTLPDTLRGKLDAWRAGGEFVRYEWDSFQDASWLSILAGMDALPERHSPLADGFDTGELRDSLHRMRGAIAQTLRHATPHGDYLRQSIAR